MGEALLGMKYDERVILFLAHPIPQIRSMGISVKQVLHKKLRILKCSRNSLI